MALFRKFFFKKPPEGLVEVSERVFVFDSCFATNNLEDDEYKAHLGGVVAKLCDQFPDASFKVFNFREGHNPSLIGSTLSEYNMTVIDYPSNFNGCPVLSMEFIHDFLKSIDTWLVTTPQNLLLLHCERGEWPVLAFMEAALLIYKKQYYNCEQKTLDMIYKQATHELLQLMSPLNPVPSQLRYLKYVSTRNGSSEWPPVDRTFTLDCVIMKGIPKWDTEGGFRPIFRIQGQDTAVVADRTPRVLFSTPKRAEVVQHSKQADCELVKMDIQCHIRGDVVLECITLDDTLEHEQMMFRIMFNTAFIVANTLILTRDEIDHPWNCKDLFAEEFKVEILFSAVELPNNEVKEGLSVETEILDNNELLERKVDTGEEQKDPKGQQVASQRTNHSKIISQWSPSLLQNTSMQGGLQQPVLRYHSPRSPLGITALLEDHVAIKTQEIKHTLTSPSSSTILSVAMSVQPSMRAVPKLSSAPPVPPLPPAPPGRIINSVEIQIPNDLASQTSVAPPSPSSTDQSSSASSPPVKENLSSIPLPPPPPLPLISSTPRLVPPPPPPPCAVPSLSSSKSGVVASPSPPPTPPPPPCTPTLSRTSRPLAPPPPPCARPALSSSMSLVPPPPPPPPCARPALSSSMSLVPPPPPPPPPCARPALGSSMSLVPPSPPPPPPCPARALTQTPAKPPALSCHPPPPISFSQAPPPPPRSNGPAPPPRPSPPAAPVLAKGEALSRANVKNQLITKKSNMKPYHWLKLTRAMQGSLWAESQKSGELPTPFDFDMVELESLFSASTPIPNSAASDGKSGRRAGRKPDKIQLIDLRRAYNCEIMLTKVKVPLSELMSSVLALDDSALNVDQVENLIKFCPTKEEMELLKNYSGDKENLGKCEQFFLELMKVPRIESKLRVFSFKIQFRCQVSDLRRGLDIVNAASEEIRSSVKLKKIMQTVLSLGNALNKGTARGSAIGFRLDSLLKLTDTRARNSKINLMNYLCKVLAEKLPEVIDFPNDLVNLESSKKVQLKYLAEEMQAISKGLEKVVQEVSASEKDGPVSQGFCKILKEFLAFAEADVRSLASMYSNVGRKADALAFYFGEDPARCPFEQVVSTLSNFVRMFIRAHDENCKQRESEKKKLQSELMKVGALRAA